MKAQFKRPIDIVKKQTQFSGREVGLTHPDVPSYVKLADNGDIYIMADDAVGIIISPSKQCVFLVADNVKFLTKEDEGLKWNQIAFNYKATKFSEPAFVIPKNPTSSIYDDIEDFLD